MSSSEVHLHPVDGLPFHPDADPNCKLCAGYGVVDDGGDFGCALVNCVCVARSQQKKLDDERDRRSRRRRLS